MHAPFPPRSWLCHVRGTFVGSKVGSLSRKLEERERTPLRLPRFAFPFASLFLTRFEAPLEPLQVLTWMLLILIVGGFYGFVVPALPTPWPILAGLVYAVLASSTIFAGAVACIKDPIDPNVRRFHKVRAPRGGPRILCCCPRVAILCYNREGRLRGTPISLGLRWAAFLLSGRAICVNPCSLSCSRHCYIDIAHRPSVAPLTWFCLSVLCSLFSFLCSLFPQIEGRNGGRVGGG